MSHRERISRTRLEHRPVAQDRPDTAREAFVGRASRELDHLNLDLHGVADDKAVLRGGEFEGRIAPDPLSLRRENAVLTVQIANAQLAIDELDLSVKVGNELVADPAVIEFVATDPMGV